MSGPYLFAYYHPKDINERDAEAKAAVASFTDGHIGSGTFIPTGERDLQWKLKSGCGELAEAALRKAGFRSKVTD